MKLRTVFCQVFLVLLFILSFSPDGRSLETKLLVVLSGDEEQARTAEDLLAKYLFEKEYEVITSAELGAGDVQKAKQGRYQEVTANYGAHFLVTGSVRSRVSSRETSTGIKLERAVSTLSYKLLDASGRRIHRGSTQNDSAGRSPDEAVYASFDYMAADTAEDIAENIPDPEPSPQITITEPPQKSNRGFTRTIRRNRSTIAISGRITDDSGIRSLTINNSPVTTDAGGRFSHEASLSPGDNHFTVAVVNIRGMTAKKDFTVKREAGPGPVAGGPQIRITEPPVEEARRGFTRTIQRARESITISGEVMDNAGIRSVTINGAPVRIDARGRFSHSIDLIVGQNNFSVAAVNTRGMTATKEFTVVGTRGSTQIGTSLGMKPPRKETTLWALLVGVSEYQKPGMSLKYADADARVLAKTLATQQGKLFSEVRIKTLVNKDVTRESIINAFESHLGMAAPGDVVFIFIAGHGIKHQQSGSYYFVTHDANIRNLVSRGIRMSDFEESVKILSKNTNVSKLIMVIDSCHSGAMKMEGLRAVGNASNDLADALHAAEGQFILSAAKAGQASIEARRFRLNKEDSGHGAFTYALVKGMQGEANYDGDEYISLTELFQYVSKQVPRLTGGRQHPYSRNAGTDMPFILLK